MCVALFCSVSVIFIHIQIRLKQEHISLSEFNLSAAIMIHDVITSYCSLISNTQ